MADGSAKNWGELISMEGVDLLRVSTYGREQGQPDCVFLAQHDGGPEQTMEIIRGHLLDSIDVVGEYLEVNRDVGSAELAHASARHTVDISHDLQVKVVECLGSREVCDPNRINEYALRNVLNPNGS